MQAPDVELLNLVKRYDDFTAVNDCTLSIERGEFVSLLGPSGCGKTTTLNMIAGFFPPTAGEIRIRGRSVTGMPPNKRHVGMVFQNYALFPHMTVLENVGFGLKMRGAPKAEIAAKAEAALAKVHMEAFVDRYPRQLSGGQQQRIALARAIAPEPSVLLLDEPLSNLDLKLRETMRRELKLLQRDLGVTAVFVTHDQDEAMTMSDRVVVMNRGRIEQVGTPEEIYARPRTQFVGGFVGQMNMLTAEASTADGETRLDLDGGVSFVARNPGGLRPTGRIIFGIRPEAVTIGAQAAGETVNRLDGTVEDTVLAGSTTQVMVRLAPELQIRVDILNGKNAGRFAVGDRVAVAVAPDDIILFEDGATLH